MANQTQARVEPVIWEMWPGKARRKGKGAEKEELLGPKTERGDRIGQACSQRKSPPGGRSRQSKDQEVGPWRVGLRKEGLEGRE